MILAGDIGGTKCNLAIFQEAGGATLQPIFQRRYATRDFSRFEDLIGQFRKHAAEHVPNLANNQISGAGFGVAGAVVEGQLHANNLPWALNPPELARRLDVNLEHIVLLNDVAATAWSLDKLPAKDLSVLNQGVLQPNATRALMEECVAQVLTVEAGGEGRLAQLLDLIHVGDWTSVYLALAQDVDPGPIDAIVQLKAALREA